jgi:hypothetical protein
MWSPWTVMKQFFWSNSKPESLTDDPCDPVTCSECPGGEQCCRSAPLIHPESESKWVNYDDDGYPARRRR